MAREAAHGVFGPLDAFAAVGEMIRGFIHGAIALSASLIVIAGSARRIGPAGAAALAIVTLDLAIANARLVVAIPQADFEREPEIVRAIRDAERAEPSPGPFRVHRLPSWVPIGWGEAASDHRLRELVEWEIDTLQPGFGLLHGIHYVYDDQSQTGSADFKRLFRPILQRVDPETAAVLGVAPGRRLLYSPRGAFDLWNARYFIIPAYPGDWTRDNRSYAAFLDQTDLIYPDTAVMEGAARIADRQHWLLTRDVQVRRNRTAFPRAWIVHRVWLLHNGKLIHAMDSSEPISRETLMTRIRSADDLRATAFVETDDPGKLRLHLSAGGGPPASTESVTVHYDSSTRVVIEARLDRPGIIVLADAFDPGWRLTIDGFPAEVLRANLLMRGAAVPAGRHNLIYTYEPASVRLGAYASLAGLVALAGLAIWAHRQ